MMGYGIKPKTTCLLGDRSTTEPPLQLTCHCQMSANSDTDQESIRASKCAA